MHAEHGRASVFILSDVRSGSTLLDQCLGKHPEIVSLGELQWLPAYLAQDRRIYDPAHPLVCSCGKPVGQCPFWSAVSSKLDQPLVELELNPRLKLTRGTYDRQSLSKRALKSALGSMPTLFRQSVARWLFSGPKVAQDSARLFDAVTSAEERTICVDSSKSVFRFRAVYALEPQSTFAVVLSRDYRAVVHSKMKRGLSLEAAAIGWRKKMRQIDSLTADLPASRIFRLKYESLCADPHVELSKLCSFLGIEFTDTMLTRSSADLHHIGGSPTKFDPSRATISLDRSHVGHFAERDLERMQELVGDEARRWGY